MNAVNDSFQFVPQALRSHRCNWDRGCLLNRTKEWLDTCQVLDNAKGLDSFQESFARSLDKAVQAVKRGPGVFVLKNVPVSRMPEESLHEIMHIVGERFGILSPMDSSGNLIHKVQIRQDTVSGSPLRGYESNGELAFHNDACDVIAFLCIRTARTGGRRRIVSAVRILQSLHEIDPQLVPPLFLPIRYQNYFGKSNGSAAHVLPLLSFADGEPFFVVKPGYVLRLMAEGVDPFVNELQKDAFFAFIALSENPSLALGWDVERGDLEIYDNFRILHARSAYEGADRCLLRAWISDPNGVPLPSEFADASDYQFIYMARNTKQMASVEGQ